MGRCVDPAEKARCDQLLGALDSYLEREHPSTLIDQDQEIPRWVIDRLFAEQVIEIRRGRFVDREGGHGMSFLDPAGPTG